MTRSVSRFVRTAGLFLCAAALAGCGGYTFRAKVVKGVMTDIAYVSADDARLKEEGLGGVWVAVFRDPQSQGRRRFGGTMSMGNGNVSFPIDGFGAGWLEEQWELQASLKGYQRAKTVLTLPSDSRKTWVLITLAPGESPDEDDFREQFEKFR